MYRTREFDPKLVDIRPLLWAEAAYLPLPFSIFRTQLLYGQLPSARVWYRNHKVTGPESEICPLCQKQGADKVDIWHIIAECSSPELAIIRARHSAEVHRSIALNFLKCPNLEAALRLEFKISDVRNGPCRLMSPGVMADCGEDGGPMQSGSLATTGGGRGAAAENLDADVEIFQNEVRLVHNQARGSASSQSAGWRSARSGLEPRRTPGARTLAKR
jgi:hypothetical protein